jgi:trans-aconitate 2-methyltransferase
LGAELFPGTFSFDDWRPQVAEPATYQRLLSPLGSVSVWETEYLQRLEPVAEGHPVRHFTQSTAMRPFAEALTTGDLARFVAAYDAELGEAYPPEADGSMLFPFRRLFFVLTRMV